MKQQLANLRTRRFWLMMLGLVILSAGIALFRLARLGNDPFTGMCFAISDRFSVSLGHVELAINAVLFVGMCFSLRHRIGWGTLFNAFLVGYVVEFFAKLFEALYQPSGLAAQIVVCMLALLITCLGCSLYLNADMGASPYDATALALAHHTPVKFFLCRMATDGLCAIACWQLGGILGLGTILAAFCMGPFISMFDKLVSEPLFRGC